MCLENALIICVVFRYISERIITYLSCDNDIVLYYSSELFTRMKTVRNLKFMSSSLVVLKYHELIDLVSYGLNTLK